MVWFSALWVDWGGLLRILLPAALTTGYKPRLRGARSLKKPREQLQKPRGPAYGLVSDWRFLRGAASCSSGGVTRAPRCMQLPARLGCTCRRAFDAPFGVANPSKSAIAAKFRPRKTRIRHIQREYLHFYAAKHARRRTRRQYFQSCAACSQLLRVMPGAAACVRGAARC